MPKKKRTKTLKYRDVDWSVLPDRLPATEWGRILGMVYQTIRFASKRGEIACHFVGVTRLINKKDMRAWLEGRPSKYFEPGECADYVAQEVSLINSTMSIRRVSLATWQCSNQRPYRIPKRVRANELDWKKAKQEDGVRGWSVTLGIDTSETPWRWSNEGGLTHYRFAKAHVIKKKDMMEFLRVDLETGQYYGGSDVIEEKAEDEEDYEVVEKFFEYE